MLDQSLQSYELNIPAYKGMTLELYNFPASTCSLKVRICLSEKKLEWVDHQFKPHENKHLTPEYLEINPNGVVPTLLHNGVPIIDSSTILEYLDEVFPERSFTPDDPVERARMRAWLRYIEEKPTPAVRYPTFNKVLINNYRGLSDEELNFEAEIRPLKRDFYKQMGRNGFDQETITKALRDISDTVERMERAIADGGPWLLGGFYSLADICVAPLIDRMEDLGYKSLWEDGLPHVTDWFKTIKARPAYTAAYYRGARYSEIFPDIGLG